MRDDSELQGTIFSVSRFGGEDGPGIRTTVFMKGCPLRCVWCHSPQSQEAKPQVAFYAAKCISCGTCVKVCPREAQIVSPKERRVLWEKCDNCGKCAEACPTSAMDMVGQSFTVDQVMKIVERDLVYYRNSNGGVTFSGGEPAMQPLFLTACLKRCKALGIHTALDTCGFMDLPVLEGLMPYVDLFLYDIKHMDSNKHKQYTGVGNELILENLKEISRQGKSIWIRVPLITGYNDSEENIRKIAELSSTLKGVERVSLLSFNTLAGARYLTIGKKYELDHLGVYPKERGMALMEICSRLGLNVELCK